MAGTSMKMQNNITFTQSIETLSVSLIKTHSQPAPLYTVWETATNTERERERPWKHQGLSQHPLQPTLMLYKYPLDCIEHQFQKMKNKIARRPRNIFQLGEWCQLQNTKLVSDLDRFYHCSCTWLVKILYYWLITSSFPPKKGEHENWDKDEVLVKTIKTFIIKWASKRGTFLATWVGESEVKTKWGNASLKQINS